MEANLQHYQREYDALGKGGIELNLGKEEQLTTSGTMASTAGYCPFEPLRKKASTAMTPKAYSALLSTMTNMTGQSVLDRSGFPATNIRHAIAPIHVTHRGNCEQGPELALPEQSKFVVIVREK